MTPDPEQLQVKQKDMVVYKIWLEQTVTHVFYQYLDVFGNFKTKGTAERPFLPQSWFSEQNNASSKGINSLNPACKHPTFH